MASTYLAVSSQHLMPRVTKLYQILVNINDKNRLQLLQDLSRDANATVSNITEIVREQASAYKLWTENSKKEIANGAAK